MKCLKPLRNGYKQNRDLLIYFLWSTGWYSNQEVGNLFGIGYSSVSRQVSIMKTNISKDEKINKKLKDLYSQIKVWPTSQARLSFLKRFKMSKSDL